MQPLPEVLIVIVSSGTIYQWVQMFAKRQGSDKFSQQARILTFEIMQTLEQSPSVQIEMSYKISWMASDDEAVKWLQQVCITVPEESRYEP
jgi:hypothetical protein